MNTHLHGTAGPARSVKPRTLRRRLLKGCAWGCGGTVLLFGLSVGLLLIFLNRVPNSYPPPANPIAPPTPTDDAAFGLDGFESPYLGHTGSWDGKGGNMWGGSKASDLDKEVGMGLRWTFMPVNWSAMEPDGPVDLNREMPSAWRALDAFVIAAQKRRLNVLMQAPVVGGNAGGPPVWAGRREKGKSAPLKMGALVEFAGKLAQRYRPGGTLATEQGWGPRYGVRAWELDNEPEMYRTHWKDQAADYAEFVTLAAAQIKAMDPKAMIVAPGLAAGKHGLPWLEAALDPVAMAGSPIFRAQGKSYSIGPVVEVVSLHNYEGLDSAFSSEPRTIGQVFEDVRAIFERWEQRAPDFTYPRKQDYWHTEGNFDFIGAISAERRAAWRMQFFTRAFAAGLRKVCVMDASEQERAAVRAYVRALPWPFPMKPADAEVKVRRGQAAAFRHPDGAQSQAGQVWILWAIADTGDAQVEVPVTHERVTLVQADGSESVTSTTGHQLTLELKGDRKMGPPVIILDGILKNIAGREHQLLHLEVANEAWQNGFPGVQGVADLRAFTQYLADQTDVPVAITSNDDTSNQGILSLYQGSAADLATVHFTRDTRTVEGGWLPVRDAYRAGHLPGVPPVSSNEPIGPDSSVSSETDPIKLCSAAVFAYLASWVRNDGLEPSTPFSVFCNGQSDRYWPDVSGPTNGCHRNIGSAKGDRFVCFPMGILGGGLTLQVRRPLTFQVFNPLTGAVVSNPTLTAGNRFVLPQGPGAYLLKGAFLETNPPPPTVSVGQPVPAWLPKAPHLPPPQGGAIHVANVDELLAAVDRVGPGGTILLADGQYRLPRVIVLQQKKDIAIRSASGDSAKVTLSGKGWDSQDQNDDLLHIGRCEGVTLADVTFTDCRSYGIKVEAENAPKDIHIYNCRFRDIGVRAIKGSAGQDPNIRAVKGSVRYCYFENTKVPPADWLFGGDYIAAIDMMALEDWTFSDNVFRNIQGRQGGGRAAIFIWVRSRRVVVERNLIVNCDRGVAFGNPGQSTANLASERLVYVADSVIRNNFVVGGPDCGIELWHADRIKVLNNTIWRPEQNWSRGIRIGTGTAHTDIVNNLVYGEIRLDGGEAEMSHNLTGRLEGYFVDPASGNLALTPAATLAIDQGVSLPEVTDDIRRRPRLGRPDLGAWEFEGEDP